MADRKLYMEVKSAADAGDGAFEGVLSTYGNVDEVGDVCEPGCFDASVARSPRRTLLWQHDQADPIGSFEVTDTVSALAIRGRINLDVSRGRDAYALLKAGDITGLSIGYVAVQADYDGNGVRHLREVDLLEGSLVTIPANPLATAQAKARRENMRKSRYAGVKSLADLTEEQRLAIIAELEAMDKEEGAPEAPAADKAEGVTEDETDILVRLAKLEDAYGRLAKAFEAEAEGAPEEESA